MTTETITPTTPLSAKDILQEMRSLGLASWVLKNDVSGLLKSTEWVSDGVRIYLRSLDEKDRGPTVEQASMLIEGRVRQKEEAGVFCAILRLAASRVASSQQPSAGESKPAENKRQRRNGGQSAENNSSATSGEAGASSGKRGTRTHYTEEKKKQVLTALESGKTPETVAAEFDVKVNTVTSWNNVRKRKAAEAAEAAAAAGNGNQGGTSTSNNEGGDSTPASSGSSAGPTTDDSGTTENS